MVSTICETRDGAIWVGCGKRSWMAKTPPGGLARWDGRTWKAYRTGDGLVQEHVNHILEDSDGALWVATDGGVSRFDGRGWTSYTDKNGLPDKQVFAILRAADDALWLGTQAGVVRYAQGLWTA
jgi:ligand-binding sensor domain-containing protein